METREKWVQQTDSKSQSELYNRINSPCQRTTTPRPSSPTMVISFYFRIASRDFPFCYLQKPSAPFYIESDEDADDQFILSSKRERPNTGNRHQHSDTENVTISSKPNYSSAGVVNNVTAEENQGTSSLVPNSLPTRLYSSFTTICMQHIFSYHIRTHIVA